MCPIRQIHLGRLRSFCSYVAIATKFCIYRRLGVNVSPEERHQSWASDALAAAERKAIDLARSRGHESLHATNHGRYESMPVEWWTSGFWPGTLLALATRTGEGWLFDASLRAENEITATIGDERIYGLHHDVGFQFQPTAVARFKLTGDREARRRGFLASAMLMSRFNPRGGFLDAWNNSKYPGVVIVDTLM